MKVLYRQTASDDVIRQFRYYLVELNLPQVALRFREALRQTLDFLRQHPLVGARYQLSDPQSHNLRSWPVAGFEAVRIFYFLDEDVLRVVRVLHGKRDLSGILDREKKL